MPKKLESIFNIVIRLPVCRIYRTNSLRACAFITLSIPTHLQTRSKENYLRKQERFVSNMAAQSMCGFSRLEANQ